MDRVKWTTEELGYAVTTPPQQPSPVYNPHSTRPAVGQRLSSTGFIRHGRHCPECGCLLRTLADQILSSMYP